MSTSLPMLVPAKPASGGEAASLPVNTGDTDSSKAFANVLNAHLQPAKTGKEGDGDTPLMMIDASALMPMLSTSSVDGKKLPLDLTKMDADSGKGLPVPPDLTWSGMLVMNNADGSGPKLYQLSADGKTLTPQVDPNMRAQVSRAMNQFSPLASTDMPNMLNVSDSAAEAQADDPLNNMKTQTMLFTATATSHGHDSQAQQKINQILPAALMANNSDTQNTTTTPDSSSGLQGLQALGMSPVSHHGSEHFSAVPQLQLSGQPNTAAWAQGLGERMQWLVQQDVQGAEIRLNPPELGRMEVKLKLTHDHGAQIHFSSPNGAVREAIEAAIPRLREMFAESGLMLGDVNVSQQSLAEQNQSGEGGRESNGRSDGAIAPIEAAAGDDHMTTKRLVSDGLVDMYV